MNDEIMKDILQTFRKVLNNLLVEKGYPHRCSYCYCTEESNFAFKRIDISFQITRFKSYTVKQKEMIKVVEEEIDKYFQLPRRPDMDVVKIRNKVYLVTFKFNMPTLPLEEHLALVRSKEMFCE